MSITLKIVGWLIIAGGVIAFGFAVDDPIGGGVLALASLASMISGIFVLGFAKVIDLLTDIRRSLIDISGKEPQKVQSILTRDLSSH